MRAGVMVMTTGKEIAHALRGGVAATCEMAGLSALGISLAALMWTVVTPKGAMAAPPASTSSVEDSLADIVTRLSRIEDPFVRGGMTQAMAAGEASGFVLHAARAWDDGQGTAILSASGGQQGAYAIGEEITPGVTLALVAHDHVEVDVGGRRMRVSFPDAMAPAMQMALSLPADYSAAAKASAIPSLSGLPLQPVSRDGAQAGLEVMPQADSRMLAATGLKPGDILLSVNGVSAATANPDSYRQQLLSGQPVDIRFERGGHVQSIRLGIQ
jgi:general secretion pathway protein C